MRVVLPERRHRPSETKREQDARNAPGDHRNGLAEDDRHRARLDITEARPPATTTVNTPWSRPRYSSGVAA